MQFLLYKLPVVFCKVCSTIKEHKYLLLFRFCLMGFCSSSVTFLKIFTRSAPIFTLHKSHYKNLWKWKTMFNKLWAHKLTQWKKTTSLLFWEILLKYISISGIKYKHASDTDMNLYTLKFSNSSFLQLNARCQNAY